jgi:hypothetical protein
MAAPKRSKAQRENDLALIAELSLQGWTIRKIGEYLELHPSVIHRDLDEIKSRWKAESIESHQLYVSKELHRFSILESELWDGWQHSKQPKQLTLEEQMNSAVGDAGKVKTQTRTESRPGDPRYLEAVLKVIEQRSRLLDLYPKDSKANQQLGAEQGLSNYLTWLSQQNQQEIANEATD